MRIRTIRRGTKGTKEGDWCGQKKGIGVKKGPKRIKDKLENKNKKDKKKVVKSQLWKKSARKDKTGLRWKDRIKVRLSKTNQGQDKGWTMGKKKE